MAKPRRKKQFIDAKVQGTLARRIICHWLLFLMVAGMTSFILQVLADPWRPLNDHFANVWVTHGPFLLVTVFLLPVFVMDAIKLSNRFAGPIYSLRRAIRETMPGKMHRKLKFRRRDFWHDLADDYNAMLFRFGLLDDQAPKSTEKELVASEK